MIDENVSSPLEQNMNGKAWRIKRRGMNLAILQMCGESKALGREMLIKASRLGHKHSNVVARTGRIGVVDVFRCLRQILGIVSHEYATGKVHAGIAVEVMSHELLEVLIGLDMVMVDGIGLKTTRVRSAEYRSRGT